MSRDAGLLALRPSIASSAPKRLFCEAGKKLELVAGKTAIRKQMNTLIENKLDMEHGLPPPGWKTVLAPVDFSPGSEMATRFAAKIAERNGGKVVLLHVIAPPPGRDESDFCFLDGAERDAASRLNQWLNIHLADFTGKTSTSVRVGASLEFTILLEARRLSADVVVLGRTRDRVNRTTAIAGRGNAGAPSEASYRVPSRARGILRHASCPVVTVSHEHPPRPDRRGYAAE